MFQLPNLYESKVNVSSLNKFGEPYPLPFDSAAVVTGRITTPFDVCATSSTFVAESVVTESTARLEPLDVAEQLVETSCLPADDPSSTLITLVLGHSSAAGTCVSETAWATLPLAGLLTWPAWNNDGAYQRQNRPYRLITCAKIKLHWIQARIGHIAVHMVITLDGTNLLVSENRSVKIATNYPRQKSGPYSTVFSL